MFRVHCYLNIEKHLESFQLWTTKPAIHNLMTSCMGIVINWYLCHAEIKIPITYWELGICIMDTYNEGWVSLSPPQSHSVPVVPSPIDNWLHPASLSFLGKPRVNISTGAAPSELFSKFGSCSIFDFLMGTGFHPEIIWVRFHLNYCSTPVFSPFRPSYYLCLLPVHVHTKLIGLNSFVHSYIVCIYLLFLSPMALIVLIYQLI